MLLIYLLGISQLCRTIDSQCSYNCENSKPNHTISDTLDELFKNPRYDARLRPNIGVSPVKIKIGFWVLSIDSVSVTDMAFGLDIFLRQDWVDDRLDHGLNQTLSLSNTIISNVWLPDTYFKNSKQSTFHEVTAKNIMIRIGPKGNVHYNTRITLKSSCIMDLRLYPFDIQRCSVIMESYGYSVDHILYEWESGDDNGMLFVPSDAKVLPQFRLTGLQLTTDSTQYIVGNWSGLVATFTFQRTYSFYLIHIYGPSALIVVISWISFLLPHEQAPARITLGVTSLLTEVTILTMSNQAIPRVNYVKVIDKYLIACFLFVFGTLVEYAILLTIANRQKRYMAKQAAIKTKEESAHPPANNDGVKFQVVYENGTAFHRRGDRFTTQLANDDDDDDDRTPKRKTKKKSLWHEIPRRIYTTDVILLIDGYSRRVFPVSFLFFNLYYWISIFYYPNIIVSKAEAM